MKILVWCVFAYVMWLYMGAAWLTVRIDNDNDTWYWKALDVIVAGPLLYTIKFVGFVDKALGQYFRE